ncbi:hypothetical protein [Streptomyces agglomeratus]|uniref:hypothetical protein n=1 Tax=Streptomyces agglomeratus TaxID=285458 RepID=UPI000854B3CF|nr:hypothetical protein [Streptomyces agglomeratus]OEJ36332.1 hypothetical protein BGK72_38900 [Streptomyces agglomeratus]
MSSINKDRPSWRRKRDKKRSELRAERTESHRQQLRRAGAARGYKGVADAEWDILRSAVGAVPERLRDEEWKTIAAVLRQLTDGLSARHNK